MGAGGDHGKGADRRKYLRIPFEAVVRYKVSSGKGSKKSKEAKEGKEHFADAASKNISSGGILMTTKEKYGSGTTLEVELDVPSLEGYSTVTVIGQVVRSTMVEKGKYENGIVITKIGDEDEEILDQFLEFFPDMEIVEK